MLLVYLDRYHLGDPLFLQRLAPLVGAHEGPLLVVHASGEAAERALEAEGLPAERVGGVLRAEGEAERALVERSARDLNRQIVHAFNEAGVAALRLVGSDRGLLRQTAGGTLRVGAVDWLRPLVRQGAVPVIASLAADEEGQVVEADPGAALALLAGALDAGADAGDGGGLAVVFLATGRGAVEGDLLALLGEPEVATRVASAGVRVRVTRPPFLRGAGLPAGADLPARPA